MSGFIGPSNKLPGSSIGFAPDGRNCDEQHCNDMARHAVVTECDSMGCEITHVCSKHYLEIQEQIKEKRKEVRECEICHGFKEDCSPFRDPAEGTSGRVYDTCPDCRKNLVDNFIGIEDDDDPYVPDDTIDNDDVMNDEFDDDEPF